MVIGRERWGWPPPSLPGKDALRKENEERDRGPKRRGSDRRVTTKYTDLSDIQIKSPVKRDQKTHESTRGNRPR